MNTPLKGQTPMPIQVEGEVAVSHGIAGLENVLREIVEDQRDNRRLLHFLALTILAILTITVALVYLKVSADPVTVSSDNVLEPVLRLLGAQSIMIILSLASLARG